MLTMKEVEALPIPEKYKATPNIYRLAQIISSTTCPDKIMSVLPLFLSGMGVNLRHQEGDEKA